MTWMVMMMMLMLLLPMMMVTVTSVECATVALIKSMRYWVVD